MAAKALIMKAKMETNAFFGRGQNGVSPSFFRRKLNSYDMTLNIAEYGIL